MVTFLVCLVVVGGAMVAVVVVTIGGGADQPATGDSATRRAGPLHRVVSRAASYLVPSGPPAQSRPRTPAEPVGVPTGPRPVPERGAEPEPTAPLEGQTVPSPSGDVTAPVAASPAVAPTQDGATLDIEEDPTATMPISPAASTVRDDDTLVVRLAEARTERAAAADATGRSERGAPDPTLAMAVPGATQAPADDTSGSVLQRTLVDDPARLADAAVARTRSRRALRRLRGMALLVLTMVGLGTLLAVTLAGLAALVAIGIRAAVGT